jgi:hypothetical protein
MKFTLDAHIDSGDSAICAADFLQRVDALRDQVTDPSLHEGRLVLSFDGDEALKEYSDPIVRLMDGWLRKLPWIIGGDTETVALRNSEQCFAFVPAGESVEVSFFTGSETEIEDYILEPTTVRLDAFIAESFACAESLVALLQALDASLLTSNEDCKDLVTSLTEAKRAWHDHQLHARR